MSEFYIIQMRHSYHIGGNLPGGLATINGIKGWFGPKNGKTYVDYFKKIPRNGNAIEIGSYHGLSLSYVIDIIKDKQIQTWSVDSLPHKELIENCNRWGVNFINKNSVEASKLFKDNFFDLIFIDADHEYDGIKSDIIHWLPKLKKYGFLMGHDYHPIWSGVIKAVKELLPNHRVIDNIWLWHKQKYMFL